MSIIRDQVGGLAGTHDACDWSMRGGNVVGGIRRGERDHAARKALSRIVGLRGWDKEVAMLHNVEGDETPAPGATEASVNGDRRPVETSPAEQRRKFEEWPGEDPSH